MAALRLCLLTPGAPRAGDPVLNRATGLAGAHGHEVTLALTDEALPGGATRIGDVRVVAVADAAQERFDVAIAQGWTTAVHLFSVAATRHAMVVSALEHERLATWQAERLAASLAYDLPVDFLATAQWVADALRELRPDARVLLARDGVDRDLFAPAPPPTADGPLRVLVDDRHALDRAGSLERRAVGAVTAPVQVTHVEPEDTAERRAALLAEADVVLTLPAGDGILGLPLEGFHVGRTAVVTAAADHAELVRHGDNALVVDHDDDRGAAAQLDRLAADRSLPASLGERAAASVADWPTWEAAAAGLSRALEEILATPPPEGVQWPVRLMADAMAGVAILRQELAAVGAELDRHRGDELYRASVRARARWERDDLARVRRVAAPLLRRARGRLLG
jgi:hypothetical protein